MSKRNFLKIAVPIGVIICLLMAAVLYLLSPPPKPDSVRTTIPGYEYYKFIKEKDNAFYDYLISARLLEPIDVSLKTEYENFISQETITGISDNLRKYIERQKPAIDMFKKGVARKNCSVPKTEDSKPLFSYIRPARDLERIMIAQARMEELVGDYKGAYEDYLDILRFGNDCARSGFLIHGLINIAVDSMALDAMRPGLRNSDSKTLEMTVRGLKEIENSIVPLSEVLKTGEFEFNEYVEYALKGRGNLRGSIVRKSLDSMKPLDNLKYNIKWLRIYFTKNKIRKDMRDFTQKIIEVADKPFSEFGEEDIEKIAPKDPVSMIFRPNMKGFRIEYAKCHAKFRGIRLKSALELYERIYGKFPRDLDTLASVGIIEHVLIDPFTNKPFKYINGRVYSVGGDFKDDNCDKENDMIF